MSVDELNDAVDDDQYDEYDAPDGTEPVDEPDLVPPEPAQPAEVLGQVDNGADSVGHPEVDAIVERLGELDQLPIDEHIEVYEDAHRRLHETLLAAGEDSGSA